ncbi:hypothetical protein BDA99DRAFT_532382 [Phascolomyces articulosus]|uniref:Galactose oxidase n=1 Tax=Phascolomyces articulosus TaxID=60185 RepID=A0AAD5KBC8_9FUNG|nr:hypothetical protein BDA99DRAFT_532382 [Phascolomyces articulosus]
MSRDLRNTYINPYRFFSSFFERNKDTMYVWGGIGRRSNERYLDLVPLFQSIYLNPENGDIDFSTINDEIFYNKTSQQSQNYEKYSSGGITILLPDNDRVLFFGGKRETNRKAQELGNITMNLEQYSFRTGNWTSLPVQVAPQQQYLRVNDDDDDDSQIVVVSSKNRAFFGATLAANGKINISGGAPQGNVTDIYDFWEYDPDLGMFSPIPETGLFYSNTARQFYPNQKGTGALPDGRIIYVTNISNYVKIFDTNIKRLIHQEVQGFETIRGTGNRYVNAFDESVVYSNVRSGGHAVLAPNNPRYIYVFGGCTPYNGYNEECYHDIAILDTEKWTWMSPASITGIPPKARDRGCVELLHDKYLVVSYGNSANVNWYNELNVLRLPNTSDPTGHFEWVTNITMDTIPANEDSVDNSSIVISYKSKKSSGAVPVHEGIIAGMAIGGILFVLCISFIIFRWGRKIRYIITSICQYFMWNPRVGEPQWTETFHFFTKLILCGIFIAYIIYMVLLIMKSPESTWIYSYQEDKIAFPDFRMCVDGFSVINDINVELNSMTPCQYIESEYIRMLNVTNNPTPLSNENGNGTTGTASPCWTFAPPHSFYMTKEEVLDGSKLRFSLKAHPMDWGDVNIFVEFYAHGANPNLVKYEDIPQPYLSKQELEDWTRTEFSFMPTSGNEYQFGYRQYAAISYQVQKHRYLTDAYWNRMGVSLIYDTKIELTTQSQMSITRNNTMSAITLDIYPRTFIKTVLEDQRNNTVVSATGPATGILGFLLALDRLLFGARPRSPWGVVQRWSPKRLKRSLHNHLYHAFGFLDRPIPHIYPVESRLFINNARNFILHDLTDTNAITDHNLHEQRLAIPSIEQQQSLYKIDIDESNEKAMDVIRLYDERIHILEMQMLEQQRRTQVQELLNNAYYHDPEVYQHLDKAFDNPPPPPSSTFSSLIFSSLMQQQIPPSSSPQDATKKLGSLYNKPYYFQQQQPESSSSVNRVTGESSASDIQTAVHLS